MKKKTKRLGLIPYAALALVASFVSVTANAGGPMVAPPSNDAATLNQLGGGVDGSTGAYGTSYNFALPAARGGAQPSLQLSYSSSGGGGLAGWGWFLGMPSIERRRLSGPPTFVDPVGSLSPEPLTNEGHDTFYFAGGRLVPICTTDGSKTCKANAPEQFQPFQGDAVPNFAKAGWHYYRLAEEGMFLRFFASPDFTTWVVQSKSGVTMELGVPLDGSGRQDAIDFGETQSPAIAWSNKAFRWNLARQYDVQRGANGYPVNRVVYRWSKPDRTRANLGYLTDIYDTPRADASDSNTQDESIYAHHTHLTYEALPWMTDGMGPPVWLARPLRVLKQVDVTSATFEGSGPRELVRRYHLGHEEYQHRQLLKWIQLEGTCTGSGGSPVVEGDGRLPPTSCERMPPLTFHYTKPELYRWNPRPLHGNVPDKAFLLDVNGDGIPDFVGPHEDDAANYQYVAIVSAGGVQDLVSNTTIRAANGMPSKDIDPQAGAMLGDWAHAGRVSAAVRRRESGSNQRFDIVAPRVLTGGSVPSYEWKAAGSFEFAFGTVDTCNPNTTWHGEMPLVNEDIDGDGYPDILLGQERTTVDRCLQTVWDRYGATGDIRNSVAAIFSRVSVTGEIRPLSSFVEFEFWTQGGQISPLRKPLASVDSVAEQWKKARANRYVDMNGDGLGDWVLVNDKEVRYWPGLGNGVFGDVCSDHSFYCSNDEHFSSPNSFRKMPNAPPLVGYDVVTLQDPFKPGGPFGPPGPPIDVRFPRDLAVLVHDVTGDGLPEVIVPDKDKITIAFNRDGHAFSTTYEIPTRDIPSWDYEKTKIMFGDMNGSGVDDFVFVTDGVVNYVDLFDGATPALLHVVDNGLGGKTFIDYESTATLSREARRANEPWASDSPRISHVVTRVKSSNSIPFGPHAHVDETSYTYRDPVYDGRDHSLRGFKKVRATHKGDSEDPTVMTETTYLVGRCEEDGGIGCSPNLTDRPFNVLRGLPLAQEVFDETGRYIASTHTSYSVQTLLRGMDGISVRVAYPSQVDTYRYDTAVAAAPSTQTAEAARFLDEQVKLAPHTRIVRSTAGDSGRTSASVGFDRHGNPTWSRSDGRIAPVVDAPLSSSTLWKRPDGDVTGWLWRPYEQKTAPLANVAGDKGRTQRTKYDRFGNSLFTQVLLEGTEALERFHETGAPIAKTPVSASKDGWVVVSQAQYKLEDFGAPWRTQGAAGSGCKDFDYDKAFHHLVTVNTTYSERHCSGKLLVSTAGYDRAFARKTIEFTPEGGEYRHKLDGFGRELATYRTDASTGWLESSPSSYFKYIDAEPFVRAGVVRGTGADKVESWGYTDGLGHPVASLSRTGDQQWIVSGVAQRSAKGNAYRSFTPAFWTGSGDNFTGASATNTFARSRYDAFGRVTATYAIDGTQTSAIVHHAFSTDSYDAAHLPGTANGNVYATSRTDGHGRNVETSVRERRGIALDTLTTKSVFGASGQPLSIEKTHSADVSGRVVRTLRYDSLGRMVANIEPNSTSQDGGMARVWRYAYDDAGNLVGTSDARGCGHNLAYDGMSRILSEDLSPCTAEHPPYTEAKADGTGTEAFYVYDAPRGSAALGGDGRLHEVFDRTERAKLAYDARGRTTKVERQVAKPGVPAADLDDRYAAHVYARTKKWDALDRIRTESTGAEYVTANQKSEVTIDYALRGNIARVGSSYGDLIVDNKLDADGFVRFQQYGDAAATAVTATTNLRRQLQTVSVTRQAPSLWSSAGYPAPSSTLTAQTTLMKQTYTYDGTLGNPVRITDERSAADWPSGAKPVTREMQYDDASRVTRVTYAHGGDTQSPVFGPSDEDPLLPARADKRVTEQTYAYDWLGSIESSDDDEHALFDRSLGKVTLDTRAPHQLVTAQQGNAHIDARYDVTGNLTELTVSRPTCDGGARCQHRFAYAWDETGQLARARRWDFAAGATPSSTGTPDIELRFGYDHESQRTIKSYVTPGTEPRYTVDVFSSLRLTKARWNGEYDQSRETETVKLIARGKVLGKAIYLAGMPGGDETRVFLNLGDSLGSTAVVIDRATGELVEAVTYQAYGATDSDYRPERWSAFRADERFTSKEDDIELGLQYFGARYYSPNLGRFISPDPKAVHELGADPNVYAYVSGHVFVAVDRDGLDLFSEAASYGGYGGGGFGSMSGNPFKDIAVDAQGAMMALPAGAIDAMNPVKQVYSGVMAGMNFNARAAVSLAEGVGVVNRQSARMADVALDAFEQHNADMATSLSIAPTGLLATNSTARIFYTVGTIQGAFAGAVMFAGIGGEGSAAGKAAIAGEEIVASEAAAAGESAIESIISAAGTGARPSGAAGGGTVTLYHGTTASGASRIASNGFKAGADGVVYLAEEYSTAAYFAEDAMHSRGASGATVMKFTIPEELAAQMQRGVLGEARGAITLDIPGTSGYEMILSADQIGGFNSAMKEGTIVVARLRLNL